MTREKLINEAVAKAIGWVLGPSLFWKSPDGREWLLDFCEDYNAIYLYVFPEIEKRWLWEEFWGFLVQPSYTTKLSYCSYDEVMATRDLALATPLQICEAFLRATGNWTQEMEAK
jgi:hypothetical protein